jgi:hypothetical protein
MAHIQGNDDGTGFGVEGTSQNDTGVIGSSNSGKGVRAFSNTGIGAFAWSENSVGLTGYSGKLTTPIVGVPFPANPPRNAGVYGYSLESNAAGIVGQNVAAGSYGVLGTSHNGHGVRGESDNSFGVWGVSTADNGIHGDSTNGDAVCGIAHAQGKAGVLGISPNGNAVAGISDHGTGIYAKGSVNAGFFDGNVEITGNINGHPTSTITCFDVNLIGGDCAENFDIAGKEDVEPGTVMVLNDEGMVRPSDRAYDNRVAGVISGAGDYKPGIVLDKKKDSSGRLPVALVGKVYCKVDAESTPVAVGDLLTTSATPGHAMKAEDPVRAFGSVIGKALRPLKARRGLIPILVALQ